MGNEEAGRMDLGDDLWIYNEPQQPAPLARLLYFFTRRIAFNWAS
jgi:hypothetical protein